ncbi:MAG TPA: response regulator [Chthonomonadaceae bacterium]|nr:response regulator [Chthonomonadaceae bacterium]
MEASTLPSESGTLLVVDDEPLMTELFQQYMTRRGFRVVTAATGQEALDTVAAEADGLRLVLLDISLPDMSGLEVARRLAERAPSLPVMIASGHDLDSSVPLPPNIACAIQKPYQNRMLAERIREILRG